MASIKQLAGQTALYGISSILGRLLSYLLIFIHTAVFVTEQYGVVTHLYAYTAFFNVLCTFGMETAFFRFASRQKNGQEAIFLQANSFVIFLSALITGLIFIGGDQAAALIGYGDRPYLVRWLALIILIDAVVAIPFARLRLENRPVFFVVVRLSAIFVTIGLNLLFLIVLPDVAEGKYLQFLQSVAARIYNPELGVGYIFLANLFGNAVMLLFLGKYLFMVRFNIPWKALKPMLIYAFPILITGLAGMANEQLDKILLENLLPDNFYPGKTSKEALGIYGACFKLSVFMMLAIQAFRYAGEPFFFTNAEDKKAPELFARVMYYFVLLSLVIFVAVSLNLDLLGDIFLRKPEYREGLFVVPYLLTGKLFFGVYVNLSIWYKLTEKTMYGTWLSILGAVATVAGNLLLIPYLGYLGSAVTSIICYLTMSAACYYYGQKYFPIPYNVKLIFLHCLAAIVYVAAMYQVHFEHQYLNYAAGIALAAVYVAILFGLERRKLLKNR